MILWLECKARRYYTSTMNEPYNYPLLKSISDLFRLETHRRCESVYICACQHILEPQKIMFEFISIFGVPKDNIHILGKIYSTNREVLKELGDEGFIITQPDFHRNISFDEQHKINCHNFFSNFIGRVPAGSRVIVIDDGAVLLTIANDHMSRIDKNMDFVGIEQTSSGFRKLEGVKLNFPIINVARSPIKLDKESPLIARLGCERINRMIRKYNIQDPRILIVGLGPIGNNTFFILTEEGYPVIGHDITFDSETEIVELIRVNKINIVIGATGVNIIDKQQVQRLNNLGWPIYLISMSSSDREFPAVFLRKDDKPNTDIHSDIKWENIMLTNNGFPITFEGNRYESTPIEIEKTIALLYGSVLYAILNDLNNCELTDVPKIITENIDRYL